jgi:threonylcarbamoyladenosine tRNA methylthiotransferase CDKAL1
MRSMVLEKKISLKGKLVCIHSIVGCYKRSLDRKKVEEYFRNNGANITDDLEMAEIVFLLTCGVSKNFEDDSLNKIREINNNGKILIVSGCLPGINKEKVLESHQGIVIPLKEMEKLDEYFVNKTPYRKMSDANEIESAKDGKLVRFLENNLPLSKNNKQFYIRIEDGCMGKCTYCAIRNAVGVTRSKAIDTCLTEFKDGLNKKFKYFVLGGDDVGSYGLDINTNFPELLKVFLSIKDKFNLIIQDFNPNWLIKFEKELVNIFVDERIVRIHCLIQSGSERILTRMGRSMKLEKLKKIIKNIKAINPKIKFDTCLIIGFPGETDKDFKQSLKYVKAAGFDQVSIFVFSMRPGTMAEKYKKDLLSEEVLMERRQEAIKYFEKAGIDVWYKLDDFMNRGISKYED